MLKQSPEQPIAKFLQQQLRDDPSIKRLVLGFSGGLDSAVLLHIVHQLAPALGVTLLAIHVHHGLSANAGKWVIHVQDFCQQRGIEYLIKRVKVGAGASLEASAREARYQAFSETLQAGDALVLAQHQDDQAETLLLRLLRGSGVRGLSAMRAVSNFHIGSQIDSDVAEKIIPKWRPLLDVSRDDLQHYALQKKLIWIEDESNQDESFDRNYLRQRIIPRLKERWSATSEVLAATTNRFQEADSLLDDMAADLAREAIDDGRLSAERLRELATMSNGDAKQRLVLRYWLKNRNVMPPEDAQLENLRVTMLTEREDASPCVQWGGVEVRRYQQWLYVMPVLVRLPEEWETEWDMCTALELPDGRKLTVKQGGIESFSPVVVRYRRGGEKMEWHGQHKTLKNLFQYLKIAPWLRDRLPIIWKDNEIMAVAGTALKTTALGTLEFELQ